MSAKVKLFFLSGWANSLSSLQKSLINSADSEFVGFDYLDFSNLNQAFYSIKNLNYNPDIVIGWSLGGQLACRLIAKKILNPKLLVIISSPFHFIESDQISCGMSKQDYEAFRKAFKISPDKTLKKFTNLILKNDNKADYIKSNLDIFLSNYTNLEFWLNELGSFSCSEIDFTNFPRTVLIYGDGDILVKTDQAKQFVNKIKNTKLVIFTNCGHCPYLNDQEKFKLILKEERKILDL